jgi:hypothetical protein
MILLVLRAEMVVFTIINLSEGNITRRQLSSFQSSCRPVLVLDGITRAACLLLRIIRIFHGFLRQNMLYGFKLKIYDFVKNGFEKKVYIVH